MLLVPMFSNTCAVTEFSDINSHWAREVIQKYSDKDIVNTEANNAFKPDNAITRAEFVKMINSVYGHFVAKDKYFSDVNSGDWYFEDVATAAQIKYVSGYGDGTFRPNNLITREEAAKVINYLQLDYKYNDQAPIISDDLTIFSDAGEISEWAKPHVESLFKKGILIGTPEKKIAPKGNLTRAEAITIIDGSYEYAKKYRILFGGGGNPLDGLNMEGDADGDTLSNGDELNKYYTDPFSKDTDKDGLDDNVEIFTTNTDPKILTQIVTPYLTEQRLP